jgi:hypothetical protein
MIQISCRHLSRCSFEYPAMSLAYDFPDVHDSFSNQACFRALSYPTAALSHPSFSANKSHKWYFLIIIRPLPKYGFILSSGLIGI